MDLGGGGGGGRPLFFCNTCELNPEEEGVKCGLPSPSPPPPRVCMNLPRRRANSCPEMTLSSLERRPEATGRELEERGGTMALHGEPVFCLFKEEEALKSNNSSKGFFAIIYFVPLKKFACTIHSAFQCKTNGQQKNKKSVGNGVCILN